MCAPGPNGEQRVQIPYFSNPDVIFEGVPTGDAEDNNVGTMRRMRFEYQNAGSNCLDGKPDKMWMDLNPDGMIGNNCPNGESSYKVPIDGAESKFLSYLSILL